MGEHWDGLDQRECGEHRTTGGRAWCFDCQQWCSLSLPCFGCQWPVLHESYSGSVADLIDAGVRPKDWTVGQEIDHQTERRQG